MKNGYFLALIAPMLLFASCEVVYLADNGRTGSTNKKMLTTWVSIFFVYFMSALSLALSSVFSMMPFISSAPAP